MTGLSIPRTMVTDGTNLYVAEFSTPYRISKVDSTGNRTSFYSSSTIQNSQLAFDSTNTYLYGVDSFTGDIYKYDMSGNQTLVLASANIKTNASFAIDPSGNLYYISSASEYIIIKLNTSLVESTFSDLTSSGIPAIVTGETDNGNIWVGSSYLYYGYLINDGLYSIVKMNLSGGIINSSFISNSVATGTISRIIENNSGIYVLTQTYNGGQIDRYDISTGNPITVPYVNPIINYYLIQDMCCNNSGDFFMDYEDGSQVGWIIRTNSGGGGGALCFKEGSKILCLQGTEEEYLEIQNIRKNMLVKTGQNGYKRVDKIGTTVLYNDHSNKNCLDNLYICKREDYPELTEDLIITGAHSILVDTMTEKQKETSMRIFGDVYVTENKYRLAACIDSRAKPYDMKEKVNIWHLSLEHPNKLMNYGIYANGLLVESASKRMMGEISGMKLV